MDTQQATATPLLTTKFYVPPFRPETVSRPRLVEQVNAGLFRKLTLISAPAGFGKTTLLSEWVRSCERPVAWLSLDEGDNDLARFMTYLVGALPRIEAARESIDGIADTVLSGLQSPRGPQMEGVLTWMINEITTASRPLALVLDDYHLITAQPVHEAVSFLLEHLAPEMHLVIASRSDPPLLIAGLRGRGQLTELRQADLRFTPEEVAAFLSQATGLELSVQDVAALSSRTEGWIAGLQLAAVSMQGRDDVSSFVRDFTGSNRYVLDYLVEEVLERQPVEVQDFLLQTSILDRLAGPLCDAVIEPDGGEAGGPSTSGEGARLSGQETLEMLERSNLFIVRLDDERRWYRYHHLFADLLRQRLRQAQPELLPTLHVRASEWHERNGLIPSAIGHAVSAQDFQRAARLIEVGADVTLRRAEFDTLRRWVEALPDEVVRGNPRLCVRYALVLLIAGGTLDEVKACLDDASRGDSAGALEAELVTLQAMLATLEGDVQRSLELSQRALELLPDERTVSLGFVERNLGVIYMLRGDMDAAQEVFEKSAMLGEKVGDFISMVVAQEKLGATRRLQGRLREAKIIYEKALESATDDKGHLHPVIIKAVLGLADILREWNDLEGAEELVEEGLGLASAWSRFLALACYLVLSRIRQAQGDLEGAEDLLHRGQQLAVEWDVSEMDDVIVDSYLVRVWLAQGDLEAATEWLEKRGFSSHAVAAELEKPRKTVSLEYLRQAEYSVLARVYLAKGEPDRALEVLGPLSRKTERQGWGALLLEALALEALALQSQGEVERALNVLRRALSLGEPEGYVRTFVDEGEAMAQLLREAASGGIAPGYVSRLLAVFEVEEHGPLGEAGTPQAEEPLAEPLSDREMQVLRLLNTSLSSTEIAEEMVVSVNTVRSHIRSIYGKLGVHSRYEAVARARELNLI
jgi:LuxR family maltose regulon positive regulatory protein